MVPNDSIISLVPPLEHTTLRVASSGFWFTMDRVPIVISNITWHIISYNPLSVRLSSTLLLHVQHRDRLDSSVTKKNTPYQNNNEDLDGCLATTNQTIRRHQAHGQPPREIPVHVKTWTYQYATAATSLTDTMQIQTITSSQSVSTLLDLLDRSVSNTYSLVA